MDKKVLYFSSLNFVGIKSLIIQIKRAPIHDIFLRYLWMLSSLLIFLKVMNEDF